MSNQTDTPSKVFVVSAYMFDGCIPVRDIVEMESSSAPPGSGFVTRDAAIAYSDGSTTRTGPKTIARWCALLLAFPAAIICLRVGIMAASIVAHFVWQLAGSLL